MGVNVYNIIKDLISKHNGEYKCRSVTDYFKELCIKIDYLYRCWDCYDIKVDLDYANSNIIVSLTCWDAMVVNGSLLKSDVNNGLGIADDTFYDVASKANEILIINEDCNINIVFTFANVLE